MSMEGAPEVRSEDQDVAFELLNSEPLLQEDEYAHRVVESGGRVDSGKVVDLGNFLAIRLATLQQTKAEEKIAAMKSVDPEAYIAAVAVKPHLEKFTE